MARIPGSPLRAPEGLLALPAGSEAMELRELGRFVKDSYDCSMG